MKRGYGIREVYACKDEIKEMFDNGYSFAHVHRELISSGKLTIKYSHFHKLLTRMKLKPKSTKKIGMLIEQASKKRIKSYESNHELSNETNKSLSLNNEVEKSLVSSIEEDSFGIIRTPEKKLF